jgi:hypothetical protein
MFKTSSLCEKLWIVTPINFVNFCILLRLTVYSQSITTQKQFGSTNEMTLLKRGNDNIVFDNERNKVQGNEGTRN